MPFDEKSILQFESNFLVQCVLTKSVVNTHLTLPRDNYTQFFAFGNGAFKSETI